VSSKHYGRSTTDSRREAFDELAIGLSGETISRGRALKLTAAALLGGALSIFVLADAAEAGPARMRRCRNECEGCCDPFGYCKGGNSNYACGYRGYSCENCGSGYFCDRVSNKRLGGVCLKIDVPSQH
jgi:hypothetical protein